MSHGAKDARLAKQRDENDRGQAQHDAELDQRGPQRRGGEGHRRERRQAVEIDIDRREMAPRIAEVATEQRMLVLVNTERTQRGLVPLVMDEKLVLVARQHSQEMLQQHYFAHDSPERGSPFDRMAAAGIRYRIAGENIALAPNVERAHTGLMNSPEHKENILRPEFRKVGIGVINGGLSGETFTQDFTD